MHMLLIRKVVELYLLFHKSSVYISLAKFNTLYTLHTFEMFVPIPCPFWKLHFNNNKCKKKQAAPTMKQTEIGEKNEEKSFLYFENDSTFHTSLCILVWTKYIYSHTNLLFTLWHTKWVSSRYYVLWTNGLCTVSWQKKCVSCTSPAHAHTKIVWKTGYFAVVHYDMGTLFGCSVCKHFRLCVCYVCASNRIWKSNMFCSLAFRSLSKYHNFGKYMQKHIAYNPLRSN